MIKFDSMPNFRKLTAKEEGEKKYKNDLDQIEDNDGILRRSLGSHKIYRSSKPDYLTEDEFLAFCELNFRTIIDLRSEEEYSKGDGDKFLDKVYALYKVKLPQWRSYEAGEKLTLKKLKSPTEPPKSIFYNPNTSPNPEGLDDDEDKPLLDPDTHTTTYNTTEPSSNNPRGLGKRHILINFFNRNLIWHVFNRISVLERILSLFVLLWDFLLGTDKRYFIRYFAKRCLNTGGVEGLYSDFIDLAPASIYAALKLLTDSTNLPVMLNCAHGKDRTGIVSALILSILGYSKQHIIQDFARSAVELEPIREKVIADTVGRMHVSMSFAGAEAESMQFVFDYIDEKYGGVTSYLENIGFTIAEQNMLKENLSG